MAWIVITGEKRYTVSSLLERSTHGVVYCDLMLPNYSRLNPDR
jgi:hypothetical protein